MSNQKQREKQIKGPDAFQVKAMSGIDYLLKHQKAIAAVLGAVVLGIAGYAGFNYFSDHQTAKRREELAAAEVQYDKELEVVGKEQEKIQAEITKLREQKKPAKPEAKPAADGAKPAEAAAETPPAPNPELDAKIADLEKKAQDIKPDHSQSAKLYQEYFEKHSGEPEGWYAGTRYATYLLDVKKNEDARGVLEKVVKNSTGNKFYQTQGRLMLIATLEDMKDFDAALSQVDELDKIAPKELKPKVLLTKGRLLTLKDKRDEAKSTYDTLIKEHGSSPEAEKARSLKALIN